MASGWASANRANLAASKLMWSNRDAVLISEPEQSHDTDRPGICTQDSVREWLITHEADAKPDHILEASSGPLKRNASSEDDLALGTEASLYGKQGVRTVQEFLRSTRPRPYFSRWNSLTSATSARSAPLSVMDVLNLWSDDPEEVLLDLGFGCEEPDISGRIPARFINNKSSARGINIQVFLDAQKNRMDIENPDVSNRFRQLEVLQQVTTAFSSLVGGASTDSSAQIGAPDLGSAETRERRKRMGMLLRRASRKTLSQLQNQTQNQTQTQTQELHDPTPTPQSPLVQPHQPTACLPDNRTSLKRARQCLAESISLTSLVEEQGPASEVPEPPFIPQQAQEGTLRLGVGREPLPMTSPGVPIRKKLPGEARESFEMEEIQSFDEGSVSESYTGPSNSTEQIS